MPKKFVVEKISLSHFRYICRSIWVEIVITSLHYDIKNDHNDKKCTDKSTKTMFFSSTKKKPEKQTEKKTEMKTRIENEMSVQVLIHIAFLFDV